jgi:hypothetical protein
MLNEILESINNNKGDLIKFTFVSMNERDKTPYIGSQAIYNRRYIKRIDPATINGVTVYHVSIICHLSGRADEFYGIPSDTLETFNLTVIAAANKTED